MFGQKLDYNQSNVLFCVVFIQLIECRIQVVCFALHEIVIDVVDLVVIHPAFDEIIDIQLGSAIHDCLDFVQEISELQTFGAGKIFEVDLSVDALDDIHLEQ